MNKTVIAVLAAVLSLTLFGCTNNSTPTEKETAPSVETQAEQTTITVTESETVAETITETTTESAPAGPNVNIVMSNGRITFEISRNVMLTDKAWLGLVPAGKDYATETDAKNDSIFWVRVERFDSGNSSEPYVFIYSGEDIAMLPQGDFTMVLCDTEENGRVVLQFPATVSGVEIKCDLTKIKTN